MRHIIRYVLRLRRTKKCAAPLRTRLVRIKKRHLAMPFETDSSSGLERSDGFRHIGMGFDEHVKTAELESCLCILGEVEQF